MSDHKNGWHDPSHIDHWEDMLPEERRYEMQNRKSGPGAGGLPGWLWVVIFLWVLWLFGFLH